MVDVQTNFAVALSQAASFLDREPAKSIEIVQNILAREPGERLARLYLGAALRRLGRLHEAVDVLQQLLAQQPDMHLAWYELGVLYAAARQTPSAIEALACATRLKPDFVEAWSVLSAQFALAGDDRSASAAKGRVLELTFDSPVLVASARLLGENKLGEAELLVRDYLAVSPTSAPAMRLYGEILNRQGRFADAEPVYANALILDGRSEAARHGYALALHNQAKYEAALAQTELLLSDSPENLAHWALKAAGLSQVGRYDEAARSYEFILGKFPGQIATWLSYGNVLQAMGRRDAAIAAYRRAIAINPSAGAAYWSLANLKVFRFSADDVAAMDRAIARPDLKSEDRMYLHFALGKAFEDDGDFERSFTHYADGNRLKRSVESYDPDQFATHVERSKAVLTPEFVSQRNFGNPSHEPIFIVGLPRSGSTLVEQILASHSRVEGTMELPYLGQVAWSLSGNRTLGLDCPYPDILTSLPADDVRALGDKYLARVAAHRSQNAPHFIDKDPNNFAHIALILRMLPNAKIIDVRRHPMGCCFSAFKQHFVRGQAFTNDLSDLGHYYRKYVELMAHVDAVAPGRVHRVHYERLIDNTDNEVRRLLVYCGLDFEDACLEFHKNSRPVRTASSEQVRQPIFREGIDQWKKFDPWLAPLRDALGSALAEYEAITQA